ncbi:MAG: hypothetical protein H6581_08955 [Bacteroidia bacterium]|nr:hypothetical protein [Bacteroidia bacterium]
MNYRIQIAIWKKLLLATAAFVFLSGASLQAQWLQPHRFQFGMSLGFGGLHEWGKPSFDIHKHRTTLRISPGLYYMSAGITQKIAYFSPNRRTDRVLIGSIYYHNDWLLSNLQNKEVKKDVNALMFMPGIHVDLNHLGQYFLEVSVGYTYAWERNFDADHSVIRHRHHHIPMAEIRIGGIFLSRKEHHQTFKYYPRDVKKIEQKKLKFKSK